MKLTASRIIAILLLVSPFNVFAHHSFAVYDLTQSIPFTGVVSELKFRNPHIAMKLTVTKENGEEETINFIEGAPANMLVRTGLRPDMIKVGTRITAYGSPKKTDPTVYFLRTVVLENGEEFDVLPQNGR